MERTENGERAVHEVARVVVLSREELCAPLQTNEFIYSVNSATIYFKAWNPDSFVATESSSTRTRTQIIIQVPAVMATK